MADVAAVDIEQIMEDYFALRSGDVSKRDIFAESFTFHAPGLPEEGLQGVEELIEWQEENQKVFPDVDLEVNEILYGDDVVMWKWTVTGTHEGEFQDIPPSGKQVTFEGMSQTTIKDSEVVENRAFFDSQAMLDQLQ